MKLRIRDNSIRLRLTQSEVDAMGDTGLVTANVSFADGSMLRYCLESSPACVEPAAQFDNGELSIRVPESQVRAWVVADDVSISNEQGLPDGGFLKILIEKDFACLAPRVGEDESDMFPHPQQDEADC